MKQSRLMSLVGSVANVVVGYGISVVTQIVVFPLFGISMTIGENMAIGAVFRVASIVRSTLAEPSQGNGRRQAERRVDIRRFRPYLRWHRYLFAELWLLRDWHRALDEPLFQKSLSPPASLPRSGHSICYERVHHDHWHS